MRRKAVIYRTPLGKEPYVEYLESLKDAVALSKILIRVRRAELGNLGDHKSVGRGVIELRISFGPGYRVYLGLDGKDWIILLIAGDKKSQPKDIKTAFIYWQDYKERLQ